ncbi:MAG: hypothetical protein RIF33_03525 [Cyclobacteriaceae bacterium]
MTEINRNYLLVLLLAALLSCGKKIEGIADRDVVTKESELLKSEIKDIALRIGYFSSEICENKNLSQSERYSKFDSIVEIEKTVAKNARIELSVDGLTTNNHYYLLTACGARTIPAIAFHDNDTIFDTFGNPVQTEFEISECFRYRYN